MGTDNHASITLQSTRFLLLFQIRTCSGMESASKRLTLIFKKKFGKIKPGG